MEPPPNYPIATPAQETRAVLQLPPSMIPFPVPSPVLGLAPPGAAFWIAVLEAQKAAKKLEKVHEGPPNKKAGKVYERVNRATGEMQLDYPPMFTYVSAEQYIEELRRVCHQHGLVVIQVGCLGEQNLHGKRDRMASGFVVVHAASASGGLLPFEFPMSHNESISASAEKAYTKSWAYFVRGFLQIPRADPKDEGVYEAPPEQYMGWDNHYAQQPPVEQLVVPVQNQQARQPVQQNQQQPPQQDWQQPAQQDWQQQPFPQEQQQGWQQPQDQQQDWQGQSHDGWQQPPQEEWQQPPQEEWQQQQGSWQQPAQQGQDNWHGSQAPNGQQPLPPIEEEPLVKEAQDLFQAELTKNERIGGDAPTNGHHGQQSAQTAEPRTPDEWRAALLARGWKDEIAKQLVTTNLNEPISPGLREEIASLALAYYQNNPEAIRVAWQGTGFEPNPSLPPAIRPRPTGLHVLRYALKMIHNNHQQPAAAQ